VQDRVDGDRVAGDVEGDLDGVAVAQVAEGAGRPDDRLGRCDAQHLGERPAQRRPPVHPGQVAEVLRHLLDDVVGVADGQEHPAGLDAARDVDRLPLAVAEVDRRARGEEVDLLPGAGHAVTGRHQAASARKVCRASSTIASASPPAATRSRVTRRNAAHMAPVSPP
jgi:hypothetical protein